MNFDDMAEREQMEVVITDVKVPFWSLVWLLVKWSIAAIPAAIILFLIGTGFYLLLFGGLFFGLRHR